MAQLLFPYPDTFIADRSPNKHLGLRAAVHRCLAAHVLRVESQIMLEEFLTRIPEFELDSKQRTEVDVGSDGRYGECVPIVLQPCYKARGLRLVDYCRK
jgi:1,8-cineole 2-endo-monooxygenase